MPQSLANVLLHLVFSTKHRQPFLRDPIHRDTLTGYLVGTFRNLDCPSLKIGVVTDHVHILCSFGRTITIAKLIEEVKVHSSSRMKQAGLPDFYWQNGYGAFSVSQSNVTPVREYIANQEEHHRERTFQDEFRSLLRKHELEWDERYVWD